MSSLLWFWVLLYDWGNACFSVRHLFSRYNDSSSSSFVFTLFMYWFIFSTVVDGKIKVWLYDLIGSRVDYDAPGHWCTTMAYSADRTRLIHHVISTVALHHALFMSVLNYLYNTLRLKTSGKWYRLFSCGTSKEGESYLVEWNESEGDIKRNYQGFRKHSTDVLQFDTTKNRFLAAGDEFND